MTMTKKEKKYVETLEHLLAISKFVNIPEEPVPEGISEDSSEVFVGYMCSFNKIIRKICIKKGKYSYVPLNPDTEAALYYDFPKTGIKVYSTYEKAKQALLRGKIIEIGNEILTVERGIDRYEEETKNRDTSFFNKLYASKEKTIEEE